ncbi:MAG: ABC transporter substrate-binding protein [Chloroflexi bacterium]|nr:ABC transporter substrate-binding protein [Chloroflexota bacterium]
MKWSKMLCLIVLAAVLVALPLLIACGGGGDKEKTPVDTVQPTPTTEPTDAPAGPVQPEGTLTVAMTQVASDPDLGPFTRGATTTRTVWSYMADYLILEKHDESGYVPCLAEEWEIAPDDMSVTFKLRQGVQFHDGWGELTSEDVKFTIETTVDPGLGEAVSAVNNLGPLIDRIETSGPYDLTIYTTRPMGEEVLSFMCPNNQVALGIVSKAYYDEVGHREFNKNPVFSGPYKMVEFSLGERMVMEAVEDHWRVVPEFKTLVFREVPELMTRVAMLETGEADIVQITHDQAVNLGERGFDIVPIPEIETLCLVLFGQWLPSVETYDPDLPWLDIRGREAMNLAIDREEMAQQLYHGMAKPTPDLFYLPFGAAREPYPYDLDRAKQLMAEAGYPNGFDAKMWIYYFAGRVDPTDAMLAIAGYWEDIGIDLEIESMNVMAVYGDILYRKTTGTIGPFHLEASNEPLYMKGFDTLIYSEGIAFPMYESAECDVLVEKYLEAQNPQELEAATAQMAQYLYDEFAFVPLFLIDSPWAKGDRVANWAPAGLNYLELEYATHAEPLGTFRLFENP